MPNIKSAIKRVETNKKKNSQNRPILTEVKNSIKNINNLIDTNKIEEAEAYLPTLMSILDSAVIKGILHRNNASNKISAISKRIADIKSGKKVVEIKKDNKISTIDDPQRSNSALVKYFFISSSAQKIAPAYTSSKT